VIFNNWLAGMAKRRALQKALALRLLARVGHITAVISYHIMIRITIMWSP
jgi:hypothetical protein